MRKVKQSAWRRRQGEGELDGVTIAAVDLPEQLIRSSPTRKPPGLL